MNVYYTSIFGGCAYLVPVRRLIQRGDEQNGKGRHHGHHPDQRYDVFRMVSAGPRLQRPHDRYVPVNADRHQRVGAHL